MFEDIQENTKSTDCKCPGKSNSISERLLALKDFQIKGSFSICCFRTHLSPPLMYQLCRSETFCFTTSHNIQASHLHVIKLCSVIIKADRKGICRFSIFRKLDFTDPKGSE